MTQEELWKEAEKQDKWKRWKGCTRLSPIFLHNLYKEKKVNHKKFKDIVNVYFALLTEAMIQTGYFYKLPYRLGELGIVKYKVKGKKLLNFSVFHNTGEYVTSKMDFGNGFVAKPFWVKTKDRANSYALNTIDINSSRHLQRDLHSQVKKNPKLLDYYLVPSMKKVKQRVYNY